MKTFNTIYNVGSVRYAVNFHNGTSTHKDGSPFYDIATFSNKRKLNAFIRELRKQGYTEE